jgi:endonuclease/exonuclease/phosphatase family metal-dependent hydrolase/ketosteroid isomerase-like protein
MLTALLAALYALCSLVTPASLRPDDRAAEIGKVLDAWHAAAARADEDAYFAHFTNDAIFMGTDATERWDVPAFRAFAHPYFSRGKAWDFHATERHVSLGADGATAWFDELLATKNLGQCRGSGVVLRVADTWKIAQYNLSIPVPNDLADEFVARIAAYGAPAGAELKVVTFNIRYDNPRDGDDRWDARRERVAEFLRAQNADVVGLQEALQGQLEYLREHVPGMGVIGVGRDDGKSKGEHSAILYRTERWKPVEQGTFWFSDTPQVVASKGWGNTIVRICTWARFVPVASGDDHGFYHYNVHLDHESQPSREKSAALLLKTIAARADKAAPVVVTGDFNSGEKNPAVEAMRGLGAAREASWPALIDSYRSVHAQETRVGTFNAFKGEAGGEKIDYVFVTPGIRVLDADIHRERPAGRDLSDHFAVWARLVLPGTPAK